MSNPLSYFHSEISPACDPCCVLGLTLFIVLVYTRLFLQNPPDKWLLAAVKV